jgi:bifunctional DNA-binding transcriptional regulator/antitoxin component of YhaV-PrlF toxin-antitoxin module
MTSLAVLTTQGSIKLPVKVLEALGLKGSHTRLSLEVDEANQRLIINKTDKLDNFAGKLTPLSQKKYPDQESLEAATEAAALREI